MASQTTINVSIQDKINTKGEPKSPEESFAFIDFDEADVQALEALLGELIIGDLDFGMQS